MLTGDKSASPPASERSQNNLITETVAERRRRRRRRGKTKRWEVEKGAGERKKACGDTGRMRRWERKKTGRQRRDHWVRGGKYSETNGTAGPEDERRQPEEAMASLDASLSGSVTQISTLISHKLQTPSSLPTSRRDKPPKLHLKGTWREAFPFSVTQT